MTGDNRILIPETATHDQPRVGHKIDDAPWRADADVESVTPRDQPFRWRVQGQWLVCFSLADRRIIGVAKRVEGYWVYRMRGLQIRHKTKAEVAEEFFRFNHELHAHYARDDRRQ